MKVSRLLVLTFAVSVLGCSAPPVMQGPTVEVTGTVANGVPGATVCADLNANGSCDPNEPRTQSGAAGEYSLTLLQNEKDAAVLAFANRTGTVAINHRNAPVTVCIDANSNSACDSGEVTGLADVTGAYSVYVDVRLFTAPVLATARIQQTLAGGRGAGVTVCVDVNADRQCSSADPTALTTAGDAFELTVAAEHADDALLFDLHGEVVMPSAAPIVALCVDRNADNQCGAADLSLTQIAGRYATFADVSDAGFKVIALVQLSGTVAGAAAGVKVCLDVNSNVSCDAADPTAMTDALGAWSMQVPSTAAGNAVLVQRTGTLTGHAGEMLCVDVNTDQRCGQGEPSVTLTPTGDYSLAVPVLQASGALVLMRSGTVPNVTKGTIASLCVDVDANGACGVGDLQFTADATTGVWTFGVLLANADKPIVARLSLSGTAGNRGAGFKVCLDVNASGTCDTGEPSALTTASNGFAFEAHAADAGSSVLVELAGTYIAPANTTVTSLCLDTELLPQDQCTGNDVALLPGYNATSGAWSKTVTLMQANAATLILLSKTGVLVTAPNATICIDNNSNSACDSGEPTTTTDANGAYTFTQVKPSQLTGSLVATVLLAFTKTDVSTPLPGVVLKAVDFTVTVANQAGITCELDADGDGVYDYWATNCSTLVQRHHYYVSGSYTPSVRITSGPSTTTRSLAAFTVVADSVLPDRNRTQWDKVGAPIPTAATSCAQSVGAPTGADTTQIQNAINAAATAYSQLPQTGNQWCQVTLVAGTYTLNAPIALKTGVLLTGQGAATTLTANFTNANLISNATAGASQSFTSDTTNAATLVSALKGHNWVEVPQSFATTVQNLLSTHTYLYGSLSTENEFCKPSAAPADQGESRLPPTASAAPSSNACFVPYPQATYSDNQLGYEDATRRRGNFQMGQSFRVLRVQGTKLVLDRLINDAYPAALNGLNYKVTVTTPAGFSEKIGLSRMVIAPQNNQGNNVISFSRTRFAVIQQVELKNHFRRAIGFGDSLDCEIRGNFIHDPNSRADTGGGLGYGIAIETFTNGCRIADNILDNNRHGILLQYGANGNVVTENYLDRNNGQSCIDILGNPVCVPTITAGISIHGMYPHMNLIEGNSVDTQLQASDYHGPSKYSTFYKNAVTAAAIGVSRAARYNAFLDNWIYGSGTGIAIDNATVADKVVCVANVVKPGGTPATVTGSSACNNSTAAAARPNSYFQVRASAIDPSAIAAKTRFSTAPIW